MFGLQHIHNSGQSYQLNRNDGCFWVDEHIFLELSAWGMKE